MMRSAWKIAWRNLARNLRRNITTAIAIGLGFAALLALCGFANRVQNFLRVYTVYGTRVGHLAVYKQGGLDNFAQKPRQFSLSPDDQAKIQAALQKMPGIEFHGPQIVGSGLIGNGCRTLPFLATGIEPETLRKLQQHREVQTWSPTLLEQFRGRGLWEYPADFGAVALSTGLARILGKPKVTADFGDAKPPLIIVDCQAPDHQQQIAADVNVQLVASSWTGMMSALDGEIVAQFNSGIAETNNAAVLTTIDQMQKLYDTRHVTSWSIWLNDPEQLTATHQKLQAMLSKAGVAVDIYEWNDERISPFYTGNMQFLLVMVTFVGCVLATLVVFSIFNAATLTVIERSQEIGMLRSLGYTQRKVRGLFAREVVILAALAALGGGIVAYVGLSLINSAKIHINPPGVAGGMPLVLTLNLALIVLALALVFVLAMLATWAAVHRTAKRNIATLVASHQA